MLNGGMGTCVSGAEGRMAPRSELGGDCNIPKGIRKLKASVADVDLPGPPWCFPDGSPDDVDPPGPL